MLHFVAVRGESYRRAIRVFGVPDFYHPVYDVRAAKEFAPGDTVVFGKGTEFDTPKAHAVELHEP